MKAEIVKSISKLTGRTGLLLRKHSPEILIAAGVTGIIIGTIQACKATKELDEIMDDHLGRLEDVEENVPEEEQKKELTKVYAKTGLEVVKLYAPAVTIEVAGIGCLLAAHGIMKKRNVALAAAYKAVEKSFADYRKRVIDKIGEDKEYELRHGIVQEEYTEEETSDDGKKKKVKKVKNVTDPNNISQYAKFFDESNRYWTGTPEYDLLFLKKEQNYWNDILMSRGHVFLNEVYDSLGIDHTKAGSVVGWVLSDNGDNFIDFGIFNGDMNRTRAFINGTENVILLDFNVDGVIYDLIEEEGGFRSNR